MPDPNETQRFDALLNAMLTKPGPSQPDDQEGEGGDVKDGEGE